MSKIIDFETAKLNLQNKIMEELKEENYYMAEVLNNIIELIITPLNMLNIDEIVISSTGEIIRSKIGKKWHEGLVSQIIIDSPTEEE